MLFGESATRDIEYAGKLAPKQRIVKIVKSGEIVLSAKLTGESGDDKR
jgi:hypothetical protein